MIRLHYIGGDYCHLHRACIAFQQPAAASTTHCRSSQPGVRHATHMSVLQPLPDCYDGQDRYQLSSERCSVIVLSVVFFRSVNSIFSHNFLNQPDQLDPTMRRRLHQSAGAAGSEGNRVKATGKWTERTASIMWSSGLPNLQEFHSPKTNSMQFSFFIQHCYCPFLKSAGIITCNHCWGN
jgi:hypothetical protein